jgi:hypothetical protein
MSLEKLNQLVEEHVNKYEPAARLPKVAPDTPLYWKDLEARAERSGKSLPEVHADAERLLTDSQYPTADCLKPDEVMLATVSPESLAGARWRHHDACSYCRLCVSLSRTDEAMLAELGRRLAVEQPELAPRPRTELFYRMYRVFERGSALAAILTVVSLVCFDGFRHHAGRLLAGADATVLAREERALPASLLAAYRSNIEGDQERAIRLSSEIIERDPDNADARLLRALSSLSIGEREAAKQDLQCVLRYEPDNRAAAQAYANLK